MFASDLLDTNDVLFPEMMLVFFLSRDRATSSPPQLSLIFLCLFLRANRNVREDRLTVFLVIVGGAAQTLHC
jgi:hypothetical protein